MPFEPEIEIEPGTTEVDSPAAATVTTKMPFNHRRRTRIAQSHLRSAKVTMPAGMGLNPSASVGLVACTDAQFHIGRTGEPANTARPPPKSGPPKSKPGAARPELKGKVYVGQQKSPDPTSGDEFRIWSKPSARRAVSTRLIGKVSANPTTGQLTTEIDEAPQVPFKSVNLQFDGPTAS